MEDNVDLLVKLVYKLAEYEQVMDSSKDEESSTLPFPSPRSVNTPLPAKVNHDGFTFLKSIIVVSHNEPIIVDISFQPIPCHQVRLVKNPKITSRTLSGLIEKNFKRCQDFAVTDQLKSSLVIVLPTSP